MISPPAIDGRRVESFFQELRRFTPHYTPDLNISDAQGAGVALMRIFSQLAEIVAVRLDQAPQKHFVAFLDKLGITLLPARPATAAVTFRLASGFAEAVRVPVGTRVTAPGEEDEIPFETTSELLAIPGVLTAAYGVDPSQDFIFRHPLDFLKQEARTPSELKYEVQSFVPAGSNRIQLDHITELKPDSFVLIGCKEKAVILKVDEGDFITLYNPVTQNFPAGTIIVPIRDFEVFNGIDIQEHILYLGHNGIFTVKEEIEIKLEVELKDAQATAFGPLDLVWQFWTKDENAIPEEEEHWDDLTIKTDGTNGLSTSGNLVLVKPKDLEIKPRQVGGIESRWIRAQLRDKLPISGPPLPEVETIKVGVNTRIDTTVIPPKPIGIPADQGFYNATPLDVQVDPGIGFFPFGTEPRQFDQFYIASKEAFSKRKAEVSLDFKLDLQTLAGPSVVAASVAGVQNLRAYSIGLRRRLFELDVVGGNYNVLGNPFDTPIPDRPQGSRYFPVEDSVPSVITNSTRDLIYAFVKTEDALDEDPNNRAGKVWVHFHQSSGPNTNPIWVDLDAPPTPGKKTLLFNPAAVALPAGWPLFDFARVFVVGGDKKLYSRDITNTGTPFTTAWQSYNMAGEPMCSSSPFVTVSDSTILVFVTGEDGIVHRMAATFAASSWTALTPATPFTVVARPFAQAIPGGSDAKVFVVGTEIGLSEKKLFECDTRAAGPLTWVDLGKPTAEITLDQVAPDGFVEDPADNDLSVEGKHIFIRGADDQLWERLDGETAPGQGPWENRTRPGDPTLRESPVVYVDPNASPIPLNVFSASGRNSIVAWQFEIHRGSSVTDPTLEAVLLDETKASDQDGVYNALSFDNTTNLDNSTVAAYDGKEKLVRLQPALTALPGAAHNLVIDQSNTNVDVGPRRADTSHLLALHNPIPGRRETIVRAIRIDDTFQDLADLEFYSRLTGVVSLDPPLPVPFGTFAVYDELIISKTEFLSVEDTSTVPELSWEYWNGSGWLSLAVTDGTRNLLSDGKVTIASLPKDIESTEVAGQENYWIRARLVSGDYGRETFKIVGNPPNQTVVSEKSSLRPPKVRQLLISYKANPVAPEACLTFNNLTYLDQTAACETKDSHFPPFERLDEKSLTIFFGFDKTFKTGPLRLLLDAAERNFDETRPPEFEWSFRKDRIWKRLDAEDGSVALTRQGILTVSAAEELTRETRFGESLFWIKGSFRLDRNISEAEYPRPLLRGIFLNTVRAIQGETLTEEIVGSGDGEQNQTHALQHGDVLEGEDIRIQEALSAEERERIERELGKDGVTDREDLGGTWVRWKEVKALFDCGPQDRCYEIDRAPGILRFGDGEHGRIVPAGVDNIRAFSYRTGGGVVGNIETNKIEALSTAVAGIESVFNPTPAGGGSDKADTNAMLTIGPRRISHRDRAVSVEDFEELALEASRQVAKVRCLRTTNLVRAGIGRPDPCDSRQLHEALSQRGWVSLIIVPDSTDPRPCPSLELRRAVKEHLRARASSIVATGERIVVRPPDYVIVAIEADIFVTTLEKAAAVETQARTKLEEFLHPVHGGPDRKGWEFGRSISKSDVFAILETIADIDRVEELKFHFRGRTNSDRVEIGPNELIASGDHKLLIKKA